MLQIPLFVNVKALNSFWKARISIRKKNSTISLSPNFTGSFVLALALGSTKDDHFSFIYCTVNILFFPTFRIYRGGKTALTDSVDTIDVILS